MRDPIRCRGRPHLRVPGHLGRARGRADEVRLRLDRLGRAARAADDDLRLRADAPARGHRVRARASGARSWTSSPRVGAADGDRSTRCSNVARLDTGDLTVSLEPTDVGAVVRGGGDRGGTHPRTGIGSSRPSAASGCTAQADPGQAAAGARPARLECRQVLAGRRHGHRVGAAAAQTRVEVAVATKGVGIPPSERDRIFSKFYNAQAPAPAPGSGSSSPAASCVRWAAGCGSSRRRARLTLRLRAAGPPSM